MEKTAVEILKGAKAALKEYGWGKGLMKNLATGQMCVMGALCYAEHDGTHNVLKTKAGEKARTALQGVIPPGMYGKSITAWNDKLERTKEDVFAKLDQAIKILKADK